MRTARRRSGDDARCAAAIACGVAAVALASASCGAPPGRARGPVASSIRIAPPSASGTRPRESERAPPPPEPVPVDLAAIESLRASDRLPALALTDAVLEPGLTTVALLDTSRSEARGMPADGGIRRVVLQEGQRAAVPVELRAGECLTVVVHGGLGVREVDAFVVAPAAPHGAVLAQEPVGGPLAIVGGQAGCFRPAASGPAEIVVLAREGSGPVLAAIFRAPP